MGKFHLRRRSPAYGRTTFPLHAIFSVRWRAKRARTAAVGDGGGRGLPFRTAARSASRRLAEPRGEALGSKGSALGGVRGWPRLGTITAARRRVGVVVLTRTRPSRPALHHHAETPRDSPFHSLTPITETLVSHLRTRLWKGTGALRHTHEQQKQPRPGRQRSPSPGTLPPGPPTKEPTPSSARRAHTTIPNSTARNSKKTKGNRPRRVSHRPSEARPAERQPAQRSRRTNLRVRPLSNCGC